MLLLKSFAVFFALCAVTLAAAYVPHKGCPKAISFGEVLELARC